MILNHMLFGNVRDEYPDTIIILRTNRFRTLLILNFLAHISPQNVSDMGDIEINHCIQMVYAKFAAMNNLLQNSKSHPETRIKFLNSFV